MVSILVNHFNRFAWRLRCNLSCFCIPYFSIRSGSSVPTLISFGIAIILFSSVLNNLKQPCLLRAHLTEILIFQPKGSFLFNFKLFYHVITIKSRKKSIYGVYFKYYYNKWYTTILSELLLRSIICSSEHFR